MHISRFTNVIYGAFTFVVTPVALASDMPRLQVETVNTRSASVVSATAKHTQNKIYISGLVRVETPYSPSIGTHVDVYLLNSKGQTLAHKKDRIVTTSSKRDRTQGSQFPYAVSFDNSTAEKAEVARVVYCTGAHSDPS